MIDNAEWRELKAQVVRAGRILAMQGQGDLLGHVSARVPSWMIKGEAGPEPYFVMKRTGVALEEVTEEDLLILNGEGQILYGAGRAHNEWPLHAAILRRVSDVHSVVHTHPTYATALSCVPTGLLPLSHDAMYFSGDYLAVYEHPHLVNSNERGEALARLAIGRRAVLLKAHGVVTLGRTVPEATFFALQLESAAKFQFTVNSLGVPSLLDQQSLATLSNDISAILERRVEETWRYMNRRLDLAPRETQG